MTSQYPVLPGLGWPVGKAPRFAVRTQKAVSGRQLRILDQTVPIWTFTLGYPFLRDAYDTRAGAGIGLGIGHDELRTLGGFFLQMQGSFGEFLFSDPSDNSVSGQYITTNDGLATAVQLQRTFGSFAEPITQIDTGATLNVYLDGVLQSPASYSVDAATGVLTFNSAPANGVVVTADFSYFFLCHFMDDNMDLENFLYQLWRARQVKFESVLL